MRNSDTAEERDRERRAWQVVRRMLEMDIVKRSPAKVAQAGERMPWEPHRKEGLRRGAATRSRERQVGQHQQQQQRTQSTPARRDRSASTHRCGVPPSQPSCRSRFGMHYDAVVTATTNADAANNGNGSMHLASWSHHAMRNCSPTGANLLRSCRSNSWRQ
jgi:hypothetical protein